MHVMYNILLSSYLLRVINVGLHIIHTYMWVRISKIHLLMRKKTKTRAKNEFFALLPLSFCSTENVNFPFVLFCVCVCSLYVCRILALIHAILCICTLPRRFHINIIMQNTLAFPHQNWTTSYIFEWHIWKTAISFRIV